MDITSAQFLNNPITNEANSLITAIIDGTEMFVPLDPANRHYAEILRQQSEGLLTIADAD